MSVHDPLHRALDGVLSPCEFEVRTNGYGNVEVVLAEVAARRLAALIETAPVVPATDDVDEHADGPVQPDDDDRPEGWGKLL
jgi:hypothetical protein